MALAPALAPAALTAVQIVGAGLVAASGALLVQGNGPAAQRALAEMAKELGIRLRWTAEQTAAATQYLQGELLEQWRSRGVSAGAIAASAREVWHKLQSIVAFSPPPLPPPEQREVVSPGPSSQATLRTQGRPGGPSVQPPTPGLSMLPTASSERSSAARTFQTEANALRDRVAELQWQVQALDQSRTLSVADITGAGGQRAAFIARMNGLLAQIRALDQRASAAMAHGLSAQDYVGLSERLAGLGATLAGLERGYHTALTNALQRAVASVEAAIGNGQPLPLGASIDTYRQLADQLQRFSQQAGLRVFSDDSRTGFLGRVAAALLPATAPLPQRPTGLVLTRPRGPYTGADVAIREEHARQEQARRLQQALQAARREMRQLLPGAGYSQQVKEILDRVARTFDVERDTLRAALDGAPTAHRVETPRAVAGPSGGTPSRATNLSRAVDEARRDRACNVNEIGSPSWLAAVSVIAARWHVELQALCHSLAPESYLSVEEARLEIRLNEIWEDRSLRGAPQEFKELVLEALRNPGEKIHVDPSLFSERDLNYHLGLQNWGSYRKALQAQGIDFTFESNSLPRVPPFYYLIFRR